MIRTSYDRIDPTEEESRDVNWVIEPSPIKYKPSSILILILIIL